MLGNYSTLTCMRRSTYLTKIYPQFRLSNLSDHNNKFIHFVYSVSITNVLSFRFNSLFSIMCATLVDMMVSYPPVICCFLAFSLSLPSYTLSFRRFSPVARQEQPAATEGPHSPASIRTDWRRLASGKVRYTLLYTNKILAHGTQLLFTKNLIKLGIVRSLESGTLGRIGKSRKFLGLI